MEAIQMIRTIRPLMLKLKETDPTLGSDCKQGKFRLVSVTYDRSGRSTVTALTDRVGFEEFVAMLKARAA